MDSLGGQPGDAGQAAGAHGHRLGIIGSALSHRDGERQVQQVHLQTDLVGDAHQRRVRERAEVQVGQQRPGIVGHALVRRIDRVEFPTGSAGLAHDVQRRDGLGLRIGLVDDHGPRAVRMPVRGFAGRAVDGPHLGARIGGHRGGVEGRVLDGVAHPEHVVRAHRFDVEQRPQWSS